MMMLDAQMKQEDQTRGMPVREAQRQAQLSKFGLENMLNQGMMSEPGFAQGMARGRMGEAEQQSVAGQFGRQTLPGRVEQTNIGNAQKSLEGMVMMLDQSIPMLEASPNLINTQMVYKDMLSKLPPTASRMFPQTYTPEVLPHLTNLSKELRQRLIDSPEHVRGVRDIQLKGEYDLERQRLANQGGMDVAGVRSQAQVAKQSLFGRFQEAMQKGNLQGIISTGSMLMSDEELDPTVRARIEAEVQKAQLMWAVVQSGKMPPTIDQNKLRQMSPQELLQILKGGGGGGGPGAPGTRENSIKLK